MEELRILSALHGIGVIILNIENIMESKILLPAQRKAQVDWQSANRIIHENKDFKTFIEYVATYKSSGKIFKNNWQQ